MSSSFQTKIKSYISQGNKLLNKQPPSWQKLQPLLQQFSSFLQNHSSNANIQSLTGSQLSSPTMLFAISNLPTGQTPSGGKPGGAAGGESLLKNQVITGETNKNLQAEFIQKLSDDQYLSWLSNIIKNPSNYRYAGGLSDVAAFIIGQGSQKQFAALVPKLFNGKNKQLVQAMGAAIMSSSPEVSKKLQQLNGAEFVEMMRNPYFSVGGVMGVNSLSEAQLVANNNKNPGMYTKYIQFFQSHLMGMATAKQIAGFPSSYQQAAILSKDVSVKTKLAVVQYLTPKNYADNVSKLAQTLSDQNLVKLMGSDLSKQLTDVLGALISRGKPSQILAISITSSSAKAFSGAIKQLYQTNNFNARYVIRNLNSNTCLQLISSLGSSSANSSVLQNVLTDASSFGMISKIPTQDFSSLTKAWPNVTKANKQLIEGYLSTKQKAAWRGSQNTPDAMANNSNNTMQAVKQPEKLNSDQALEQQQPSSGASTFESISAE